MVDILVRPQELRQVSEQLRASAQKVGAALQAIDDDVRSLKGDKFLGNRANTVQAHYAPKREALLRAKEVVAHFSEDLKYAANRFEQADRSNNLQSTLFEIPLSGLPFGSSFGSAYWNLYEVDKNFLDIMTTFMSGRGDFKETLKLLGMKDMYGFFKNGIPYRDAFDSALRKFNNPFGFTDWKKEFGGFFVASVAIGTLEDLTRGTYENGWKALGVNTVDGVINVGLSNIPHVRAALLLNGAVQLGGNLEVGLEKIASDFIAADDGTRKLLLDQIEYRADALEKMDLGNITKSFSESICDGFVFTEGGRNDLVNTGKSVVNVLDGATEFIAANVLEPASFGVTSLDRAIQSLPVSDEFKRASTSATHDTLQFGQDLMKGFVNLFEWK